MLRNVVSELYDRDIPVLRYEDRQLLEDIYDETVREIGFRNRFSNLRDAGDERTEEITIVRRNLVKIIDALTEFGRARSLFVENFPQFAETRRKNITSLMEIGNSIHLDRRNTNISRLVGNCTSFAGGTLVVSSTVLSLFTFGATLPFAVAGASMAGLGGVTSVGASITENVLLNQKIKRAQSVIDEDKEASRALNNWLTHAAVLEKAFEEISNISIMGDIMKEVRQFINRAVAIKAGDRKGIVKLLVHAYLQLAPVQFSSEVSVGAMLLSMLAAIILLHERNRLVFDCASLTFRSMLAILSLLDTAVDTATILARTVTRNASLTARVGGAIAKGAVAVVGLTLDAACIILTSIDVHNGSINEYGQKLIETAEKMAKELEELQKVFDSLNERRLRG